MGETIPTVIKRGNWCRICSGSAKSNILEMQKMAATKGGKCLSQEYKDTLSKLEWECNNGHAWKAIPISIKRGSWCPECSSGKSERICRMYFEAMFDKKFPKSKPSWLVSPKGYRMELDGYCEELKLAFEYQGLQHYSFNKKFHRNRTLTDQKKYDNLKRDLCFKNRVTLIEVPCTVRYDWLKSFILRRCHVSHISVKNPDIIINPGEVYSPEYILEMKKIAKNKGGDCLSTKYMSNKVKLKWICSEGHEWYQKPEHVKNGHWCPQCANKRKGQWRKLNIDHMQRLAERHNGNCVSTSYINTKTKIKWKCKNQHVFEMVPNDVQQGHWCPTCRYNKKKYFD